MLIKKQKILLFLSIILVMLYLGVPLFQKSVAVVNTDTRVMGVTLLESDALHERIMHLPVQKLEEGILFNYIDVPFDIESQTIYISQNVNEKMWEGQFGLDNSLKGYKMFFEKEEFLLSKKDVIKNGETFSLYLVGESLYKLNVIFTGLGVLDIKTTEQLPQVEYVEEEDPDGYWFESEPRYMSKISLLCADANGTYQTVNGYLKYHVKGASSYNFPKKSYAVTFVDKAGKKVPLSFLGMESNAKWKLNSLYTDNTLLREKTAADIWGTIDENNRDIDNAYFETQYVEVVVDGSYQGVYLAVEALDENKFHLDANDVLYKCIDWNITNIESIDYSAAQKWKIQYPIRIKYPEGISDYVTAWAPIRDYMDVFFHNGDCRNIALSDRVNIPNLLDLNIFLEVCALNDNNYKNIYYAAHVNKDGTYIMYHHPWDLNLSFGHIYTMSESTSMFKKKVEVSYRMDVLDLLIEENPDVGTEYYRKYREYRNAILSDEQIKNIFMKNRETLQNSGAYSRNLAMWEHEELDKDYMEVLEYTLKHLAWLDDYMAGNYAAENENEKN